MRKALALLVVAVAIAVTAGLTLPADAVHAAGQTLSMSQLQDELTAIHASPSYTCYLQAQEFVNSQGASTTALPGATSQTWSNASSVLWSNLRAEQLAVVSYVEHRDPAALSEAAQKKAITSLENSITQTLNNALSSTTSSGTQAFTCPGAATGTQTLASMPGWFIADQVEAEAATLALAGFSGPPIPTSGPGLEAWYKLNSDKFVTYCVGIVVVPQQSTATEIAQKINSGALTIAEAARQYSTDPTSTKGGSVGCYGPTTSAYPNVQADLAGLKVGEVGVHYDQQTASWVLIGATSVTPNEFKAVATQVAQAAAVANADAAGIKATEIQKAAGITVNPAIGSWVVTTAGGTIAQPPVPPASSVLNPSANRPVAAPTTPSSSAG
jgi:hypothetical protein